MKDLKRNRIEEVLHRLAAQFIVEESSTGSLITVTRVEISPSGKEAKIFFTTLPETQQETALKFLERKTAEFKLYVRDHSRINFVPHTTFCIDYGERNRQRLDTLS